MDAAEAEQKRFLGDQYPRIVDDAEIVLDQAAGTIRLGGVLLEYPVFSEPLLEPTTNNAKSLLAPRDWPVLRFLKMIGVDPVIGADQDDSIYISFEMVVFKQTSMVTLTKNREALLDQMRAIHSTDVESYSGTIGDFRTETQCWLDVFKESRENGLLISALSIAGPGIASSTILVVDLVPAQTFTVDFVRSMATQACGGVPEGFSAAAFS